MNKNNKETERRGTSMREERERGMKRKRGIAKGNEVKGKNDEGTKTTGTEKGRINKKCAIEPT